MVVELLLGFGFAVYTYGIARVGADAGLAPPGFVPAGDVWFALHAEFTSHLLLITLMIAASLVDIDEQTIPDLITIPGTLLGLLAAAGFACFAPPLIEQYLGSMPN